MFIELINITHMSHLVIILVKFLCASALVKKDAHIRPDE